MDACESKVNVNVISYIIWRGKCKMAWGILESEKKLEKKQDKLSQVIIIEAGNY